MKARLIVTGVAAVLAGAGAVWLAAHQPLGRPTEPGPVLTVLVGVSLVGSGLGAWRARPENRLGQIMVFTGFAWFAAQLVEAQAPWLYTTGLVVQSVFIVGFVYLLLSFPSGRLPGLVDRGLVVSGAALTVGLQLLAMLYGDRNGLGCPSCSGNLLQVFANNTLANGLLSLQRLSGGVLIIVLMALLLWRWLRAGKAERRAVAPVLVAGCATLAALTWDLVEDLTGNPFGALPATVFQYTFATVPIAVLIVFLQRRLARGMVAGLVVELGSPRVSADLCEALARALGDPSLELAFWFPAENCYVDGNGGPVALPDDATKRGSTFVERAGHPVAVLLHDPVLEHNSELVRSVCAAASLALDNERLQAELRAQLIELQASRARLVEATDTERRRIERDLHDGTQQRLVSISMSLGLLEAKLPEQATAVQPLVHETRQALASALEELRELTHGINPPLLTERGLAAALDELCRRAALPAHLTVKIDRRLPDQVESAAYFMASEALTNAAKHAHANGVRMAASYEGRCLTVEVADDGVGGAATAGGSGLQGLADRVEALGGRFTVSSQVGRGTTLRAEIPMRVVVADDAVLLREGLSRLLEEAGFEVAGLAADADTLLELVERTQPDVAIIDIRMPPTHTDEGLRGAKVIREKWPTVGLLVLSQHVNARYALELLSAGTDGVGYLLKERVSDLEELSSTVNRVGQGGSVLDPAVVGELVGRRRQGDNPVHCLTDREREVLALMAEGRSNHAIAERLFVSDHTVEKHVNNIFGTLCLPQSPDDHRRVLAVITYLNSQ